MSFSWLEDIKYNLVRISSPYAVGNGIICNEANVIVTLEHLVRDTRYVIIEGVDIRRQKADVVYLNEKLDLAFIMYNHTRNVYIEKSTVLDNDVVSVCLTYNNQLKSKSGRIINIESEYIYSTAYLNQESNGAVLFTTDGKIIGINTFQKINSIETVTTLSIDVVLEEVKKYQGFQPHRVIACDRCNHFVVDKNQKSNSCPFCNNTIRLLSSIKEYEPRGIEALIERVISELNYDIEISRRGYGKWQITEGSAEILITYQDSSGFVFVEALLAHTTLNSSAEVFKYLLKQNYFNKGMSFSIKDDNLILSLAIYDQHLHLEACKKLLASLIKSADRYDNILINQFGAIARY